jgi:hypothetical protein
MDARLIRATEGILAVTEALEDEGVVKYLRFTDVSPGSLGISRMWEDIVPYPRISRGWGL